MKVFIEDKYKLYGYRENNHESFFIKDDEGQFQQLIYKKYLDENGQVVSNVFYKYQLSKYLSKEKLEMSVFENLNYSQYDFEKLFKKVGAKNIISDIVRKDKNKNSFRIYLQPGINSVSPSISLDRGSIQFNFSSKSKTYIIPAIEMEYNLQFNRNKWSTVLDVSDFTYDFEGIGEYSIGNFRKDIQVKMDYKSTDIGIGIKHYMFLNDNSSIFIGSQYNLSLATKGKTTFSSDFGTLDATNESYLSFETGYNYKNHIGIKAKLNYKKPFTSSYYFVSNVNTISFMLTYNIVHKK